MHYQKICYKIMYLYLEIHKFYEHYFKRSINNENSQIDKTNITINRIITLQFKIRFK